MAGIVERDQTLKRESHLSDLMTIVDRKSCPFMSQVKKGAAPKNSFVEWPLDKHKDNLVRTATYSSGVSNNLPIDGEDISSSDFENYDDRTKCSVYLQYARRVPKVSRLANMTSDIAGVGYKEMANSIAKALVAHKRDIEATLCSSQETAQETAAAPYQTRGLGKWVSSSAQATLPVPEDFRTPSGSIKSYLRHQQKKKIFVISCSLSMSKLVNPTKPFTVFVELKLRKLFLTSHCLLLAQTTLSFLIVTLTRGRLSAAVDIIESDFGTITLNLSSFLSKTLVMVVMLMTQKLVRRHYSS